MAKVNVNSASSDELVEAGVKAELAEEILKLRRKGQIESAEALDALPGVGPATLEQLRKTLDFSDKAPNGGDRDRAASEGERSAREMTEKAADVADSAARSGAEAVRRTAETGLRVASTAARSSLQTAQRTVGAAAEVEGETARRAAEGTSELSQAFVDFWNEQTRHNIQAFSALSEAVDWKRIFQIQSELMNANLERMSELARRYVEVTQAMTPSAMSAVQDQAGKAA